MLTAISSISDSSPTPKTRMKEVPTGTLGDRMNAIDFRRHGDYREIVAI